MLDVFKDIIRIPNCLVTDPTPNPSPSLQAKRPFGPSGGAGSGYAGFKAKEKQPYSSNNFLFPAVGLDWPLGGPPHRRE